MSKLLFTNSFVVSGERPEMINGTENGKEEPDKKEQT
jgi:hypothetical protein